MKNKGVARVKIRAIINTSKMHYENEYFCDYFDSFVVVRAHWNLIGTQSMNKFDNEERTFCNHCS